METIVLLGPSRAGKSTAGRLLAQRSERPFAALPAFNIAYLEGAGANEQDLESAWSRGFEGWYHYVQPFIPVVLRQFVQEHTGGVLEIDPMLLVLDDPQARANVGAILAPHMTMLLLPTPDVSNSVRALRDRQRIMYNGQELNYYFVTHPANRLLAKQIVYTKGKTAEETADEVLTLSDLSSPIILIGPMNTGKSTVGQIIGERTKLERASLDHHRWRYYEEQGFTRDEMQRLDELSGPQGVIEYWKRFDVHTVDRFLEEHRSGVLDFGAGHSVYDDPDDLETVRARLEPFPNVVLLMPSPDLEESYEILKKRSELRIKDVEVTEYLMTSGTMHDLAKAIIYTDGCTPEETCQEIMERVDALKMVEN